MWRDENRKLSGREDSSPAAPWADRGQMSHGRFTAESQQSHTGFPSPIRCSLLKNCLERSSAFQWRDKMPVTIVVGERQRVKPGDPDSPQSLANHCSYSYRQ